MTDRTAQNEIPQKKILILSANPQGTPQRRLDQEVRDIRAGLERSQQRSQFVIEPYWAVRPIDVRRALLDVKPQIVHFSGYGAPTGELALENLEGKIQFVSPGALAGLFELFADQLECVVLNACYSGVQAAAIAHHIPYVVGMSQDMQGEAAIEFAVAFYDALGAGESVEFAYQYACRALPLAGLPGDLIPVLKQQEKRTPPTQIPDIRTFDVSPPNNLHNLGITAQDFVGRNEPLQTLDDLWKSDQYPTMVAITGLPGVGKTELAVQYGRSRRSQYLGGVAWFPAAEFGVSIRDWMQRTFCPDRDLRHLSSVVQQVALGWSEWQDYCGSERLALVIIDDVTDYRQQVAPYLPAVESARSPFRLLLTTRADLGQEIPQLELRELEPEAAIAMLARFAGSKRIAAESERAKILCNRLGYLPLAIALAGGWLRIDRDRTLELLIQSLEQYGLDAPVLERDRLTVKVTAERGLKATFAVSWAQLAALHPSAQQLARVFSLFAAAEVPWELVTAVVAWYTENYVQPESAALQERAPRRQNWLQKGWLRIWRSLCRLFCNRPKPQPPLPLRTPITDLVEAKGALLRLHLMQRVDDQAQTYRLHPLLREFFAAQWSGGDRAGWTIALIQVISDRARRIPKDLSWEQAKDYELWRPHLEAARQILQAPGAASTDPQGVSHHKQLVNFIDGGVFRLSNPVLFERTSAQASKLYDEAKAAAVHGKTQQARQKFAAALEAYRNVIDQARIAFPADSLQLAGYLHRLAELFEELGRYREGIPPAEEAVSIARTKANSLKLAKYLNNLAGLYESQGRYSEAEPLYVQALELRQRLLGQEHPAIATSLNNLAYLYASQGRYTEAEPLYQQALAMWQRLLGEARQNTYSALAVQLFPCPKCSDQSYKSQVSGSFSALLHQAFPPSFPLSLIMTDPLASAIEKLASVLERLEQKLDAQLPETGTKREAAKVLGVSVKTLERRLPQLTQDVHYWYEGRKLVFDLELMRDWQRNHNSPAIHQRAIEAKRKQLLSQKKRS